MTMFAIRGLILALVFAASADARVTTFSWTNGTGWPSGTTVELCVNNSCFPGLDGESYQADIPINHGDDFDVKARAYASGYMCGDPLVLCEYSDWTQVYVTFPNVPGNVSIIQDNIDTMAAPTYVRQHNTGWGGTGNGTITLTTPPTVGNLLVIAYTIAINPSTNTAAPAISDNQGNTATQRAHVQQASGGYSLQAGIFTIPVVTSSGTHTVTINPEGTASETYASAVAIEVSGQAAAFVDLATGTTQSSATPAVALGARTYAEDLVIGVLTLGATGRTITPGSGWTQIVELDENNATYQALNAMYQSFTSTGTTNPTWTISSGEPCSMAGIAIKGSAASATNVGNVMDGNTLRGLTFGRTVR